MITIRPDPRLQFTPLEIVDEALIDALADLGTAERAAQRGHLDAQIVTSLDQARAVLEAARQTLAAAPPIADRTAARVLVVVDDG